MKNLVKTNFRLYDAGKGLRPTGDEGDCQVRALHTASGLSYNQAWDALYTLQGKYRTAGFRLGFYLEKGELSVIRNLKFPAQKGKPRMTAVKFVKRYQKGSFILRQANHVVAAQDGIIFDTFDSTERCVYQAWEIAAQ
jgi:hypothetical protein